MSEQNNTNVNNVKGNNNQNGGQPEQQKGDTKVKKEFFVIRALRAAKEGVKAFVCEHPMLFGFIGTTLSVAAGGTLMAVGIDQYTEYKRSKYAKLPMGNNTIDAKYTITVEPVNTTAPAEAIETTENVVTAIPQVETQEVEVTNF